MNNFSLPLPPSSPFITVLLGLVEDTENALPNLTGLLAGINTTPDTSLLVVGADGGGLGVVGGKTLAEGVGVVVGSLDQRLAGDIVHHVLLGGVEDLVVRAARRRVHQAASDTRHEQSIVDLQLNGVLERKLARGQHLVQTLSLGNGTGETVQNETGGSISSGQFRHSWRVASFLFSSSLFIFPVFSLLSPLMTLVKCPWGERDRGGSQWFGDIKMETLLTRSCTRCCCPTRS